MSKSFGASNSAMLSYLLVLSLALFGTAAFGQVSAESDDPEALIKVIKEHLVQGEYSKAIERMEALYKLTPKPVILFNIAVAYEKSNADCNQKIAAYTRFFGYCGNCRSKADAEKRRTRVYAQCSGTIEIRSTPTGLMASVDGEDVGPTPVSKKYLPGPHDIQIWRGVDSVEKEVAVTAQTTVTVHLTLGPEAVTTSPETNDGPVSQTVVKNSNRLPLGPMMLTLGASTGLALGGYLMNSAKNDESELSRQASRQQISRIGFIDRRSKYETTHTTGVVLASVSSAAVIAGIYWWYQASQPGDQATLNWSPNHEGVTLWGTW